MQYNVSRCFVLFSAKQSYLDQLVSFNYIQMESWWWLSCPETKQEIIISEKYIVSGRVLSF